ncbi:hypothetical protein [Campylobacter sp. JMF_03 NE3]|uniref:hypothetical protein n=1 Tax=Campylobacter sp. JMF_03 NE3 TaxID=2983831 RepID=UPI0022E9D26A|nr:hypothetical protein [Campylobacter sp. JMF_03 NE3]MDA3053502.1 hypothetical protein [Campylobacter sp. JMF_03 NE3]
MAKNDLMTRQKATRYLPNKMVKINNQIGFMTFDWSEDEIQDGLIAFFEDNLRNEQITNKG